MKEFFDKAFNVYNKGWALLTAGKPDNYNTMTISWGGLGTIWNKDVVTVYVRPNRYTYGFIEANDYFTVSFYNDRYKKDLGILGTLSGKDGDKVAKTSLTPINADESVTFKQAKLTLLCKKIYRQDMILDNVPKDAKEKFYTDEPMHTMYIGQVVKIIEG